MPTRAGSSYPDTWRIPDLSEPRYSQSLERGLAILECFTPETPVLGIADVAERLGMSRSRRPTVTSRRCWRSDICGRERGASTGSGYWLRNWACLR